MIRIISREQIRAKTERFIDSQFGTLAGDHLVLLEVGARLAYDQCHIVRAVHLSDEQLASEHFDRVAIARFSRGSEVVLYGENAEDFRPWRAAEALSQLGFTQLFVYEGGKADWRGDHLWIDVTLTSADGFSPFAIQPVGWAAGEIPLPDVLKTGKKAA